MQPAIDHSPNPPPVTRRKTLNFSLWIGVCLLLALLTINAGLSYRNTRHLKEDANQVAHTYEVLELSGDTLLALVDAETGARGFVITGQEEFLQPYDLSLVTLGRKFARLKELTKDDASQQARIQKLEGLAAERLRLLKETIALRRESAKDAGALVATGTGRAQMDLIRREIQEFKQVEADFLTTRKSASAATYRAAVTTGVVTALLELSLVGAFVWLIHRSQRASEKAAEILLQSERRFRAIVNSSFQYTGLLDAEGRMLEANQTSLDAVGTTADAVVGTFFWATPWWSTSPEVQEQVREGTRRAAAGEFVRFETKSRMKDGAEGFVDFSITPIRDEHGKVVLLVPEGRDITDIKRADEALRESSHFLQRVTTVTPSVVYTMDIIDLRITWINAQVAPVMGYSVEEVLEMGSSFILRVMHPDDLLRMPAHFEQLARSADGELVEIEYRLRHPDGTWRWFGGRKTPFTRDADGNVREVIGTSSDISERKKAAEALHQNAELFSTLIAQAPMGTYVVDAQFRVHQVNAEALPVFAAVQPVIGRDFREVLNVLWGPEVGGRCADIFRLTLETGERYVSPRFTEMRNDLGIEQTFEWQTQRVSFPDGRYGVACYFNEVTERELASDKLREAKEIAEAANRSKDRFLAVLSHELRTPLTPVLMTVAALEHDPGLRRDVREEMSMIRRNIELETKLIDDLLDVSRIASGKLELRTEPLDLNGAVLHVCAMCRPQLLDQEIQLTLDLCEDVGFISADPARFEQVLWNVLKNAVKFTPLKGAIRIASKRLSPERVEVRITDTGAGIAADVLPRIFDAFEQGDALITRQFGGLGLGLAISKALVDLHGGSICAESGGAGHGATFIIEVPGIPSPLKVEASDTPAEPERIKTRALRLLIAEDHADTARSLKIILTQEGFTVTTAGSIASALALAKTQTFDILVSDLGLPDGSGHELMTKIQDIQQLRGIAMSGYGMEEDVRQSLAAGFSEHLVKPVKIPRLIEAILQVRTGAGKTSASPGK